MIDDSEFEIQVGGIVEVSLPTGVMIIFSSEYLTLRGSECDIKIMHDNGESEFGSFYAEENSSHIPIELEKYAAAPVARVGRHETLYARANVVFRGSCADLPDGIFYAAHWIAFDDGVELNMADLSFDSNAEKSVFVSFLNEQRSMYPKLKCESSGSFRSLSDLFKEESAGAQ